MHVFHRSLRSTTLRLLTIQTHLADFIDIPTTLFRCTGDIRRPLILDKGDGFGAIVRSFQFRFGAIVRNLQRGCAGPPPLPEEDGFGAIECIVRDAAIEDKVGAMLLLRSFLRKLLECEDPEERC